MGGTLVLTGAATLLAMIGGATLSAFETGTRLPRGAREVAMNVTLVESGAREHPAHGVLGGGPPLAERLSQDRREWPERPCWTRASTEPSRWLSRPAPSRPPAPRWTTHGARIPDDDLLGAVSFNLGNELANMPLQQTVTLPRFARSGARS
jgi:hypothetical protein